VASPVIIANGVSKKFARSLKRSFVYGARDLLRHAAGFAPDNTLRASEFWAISDVSFELEPGRALGIVGRNGSGKTTLLRTVCGILQPTSGQIRVSGKIAPLLALGAGFKPVLSGRENIYLNMSLLGTDESQIRQRLSSVIGFAELEDAIDAPLGTYSSGMLARLGFSCAIHTEPSILVVDEILSVGDARFRAKCRNEINRLRKSGTSMLIVSHSAVSIETLCDEAIWLDEGKIAASGKPKSVIDAYERAEALRNASPKDQSPVPAPSQGAVVVSGAVSLGPLSIEAVELFGPENSAQFISGVEGSIRIRIRSSVDMTLLSVNVLIAQIGGASETVQLLMSRDQQGWLRIEAGKTTEVVLTFAPVTLAAGTYRAKVSISQSERHDICAVMDHLRLVVSDRSFGNRAQFLQPHRWSSDRAEQFDGVNAGPPEALEEF
jgi:ABC-type polysaccharide/polyol phosphate transport system ATPase subunit